MLRGSGLLSKLADSSQPTMQTRERERERERERDYDDQVVHIGL